MRAVPLMKTCEKLCEKIENRNPVSWNDVVQTCLAVCFLSWLDMLQRRPPDTCSSSVGSLASWLSQRLLLCVGEALCQRRPPKVLWSVCLACWTMCAAWLFPGDRKMAEKQRSYWTFVGFLLLQSELALVVRPFRKKVAQQSLLVAGTLPFLLLAGTLLFLLLGSHALCCKPQQWGSSYGKGSASSSRWGCWNQQESWGSRAYGGQDHEFVLRVETGEHDKKRRKRSKKEKKRRKSSSSDSSTPALLLRRRKKKRVWKRRESQQKGCLVKLWPWRIEGF